jgi:hypothetical protein
MGIELFLVSSEIFLGCASMVLSIRKGHPCATRDLSAITGFRHGLILERILPTILPSETFVSVVGLFRYEEILSIRSGYRSS